MRKSKRVNDHGRASVEEAVRAQPTESRGLDDAYNQQLQSDYSGVHSNSVPVEKNLFGRVLDNLSVIGVITAAVVFVVGFSYWCFGVESKADLALDRIRDNESKIEDHSEKITEFLVFSALVKRDFEYVKNEADQNSKDIRKLKEENREHSYHQGQLKSVPEARAK